MHRFHARILSCLLALAAGAFAPAAYAQTQALRWHSDLDRAAASARESGKPLFVVFRCVR